MAYEKAVKHLDLADLGFPGEWIDLKDPGYFSHRKMREFYARIAGLQERVARGDTVAANADDEFYADMIAAWHVKDADTGEILGEPSSEAVGGMALKVRKSVFENVLALFEATAPQASSSRP